jgi:hypothetical protein
MSIKLRTRRPDPVLKQIIEVLKGYEKAHPLAEIEIYRQNSVSVRVRVINPEFKGQSRAEREHEIWKTFDQLPEEVAAELSLLLLFTPAEAKKSFANVEFDDPTPSRI